MNNTVPCPHCNGTGEVERPECFFDGCGEKMIRTVTGDGWVCPIHQYVQL